jgi:hypothetical protein
MADRGAGFAGFKQRLARGAAGLNAIFTDDAVREKAGALLSKRLNAAVDRGQQVAGQQLGACVHVPCVARVWSHAAARE